jgi:peptide/nickel transport system ATP-binding protein
MTSLDPAFTIGSQVAESIRLHNDVDRATAREQARVALEEVGIPAASERLDDYPHQLSGGMRQRVMIAMALACRPRILIADEPTTALDVTIQAQILDVLRALQRELDFAVVLVTHDLGVVSDLCDRVVVMYAGQVVEEGAVRDVFAQPRHPYTAGLLGAMPQVGRRDERLTVIPGVVPSPDRMPTGCRFRTRCPYATQACSDPVPLTLLSSGDRVRCVRFPELDLEGVR